MLKRTLFVIACAAALAACGAPSGSSGVMQTAEVRVTDEPCEGPGWFSDDLGAQPEIFGETIYEAQSEDDASVGISVTGPEGSTCTGSAKDDHTLTCVMQGPIFGVAIQDTVQYRIPEGRTATYTHERGVSACFLNEAAG